MDNPELAKRETIAARSKRIIGFSVDENLEPIDGGVPRVWPISFDAGQIAEIDQKMVQNLRTNVGSKSSKLSGKAIDLISLHYPRCASMRRG